MAIVYRGVKGSRLTTTEIDNNFEELSDLVNTKVDSSNVRTLVDSAYVQLRQDYAYSSLTGVPTPDLFDSNDATTHTTNLVDSAYVNARVDLNLSLDSAEAVAIVDSAYVQARQDFSYNNLINTPTNVSSFTNDENYLDSAAATNLMDSAYVQARQITYDFDSDLATKTTTDVAEGNNLYYTTARHDSDFDIRLVTKTTTNVAEGNNLYYTQARFDSAFNDKTTTDLTEGTQRYYTSARADSDAKRALTGGTGVTYAPATGTISIGQEVGTSDNVAFQAIQVDDLTVSGTQTTVNTQTLNVVDPMIKMADGNNVDINDIGFFGQYGDGTTIRHTGLFRDASDKQYYLYSELVDSPTSFVNRVGGVGFELSTLNVGTINASNILDSGHVGSMIQSLSTDSAAVFLLVDSSYIQARQIQYDVSGTITSTVDAAYVQARQTAQDFSYGSLTGAPTNVSTFTNDANYVSGTTLATNFLNLATNLVPDTDSARDLGTSSKKWRELHLSGNTIFLGGEELSAGNDQLKLNGKSLFNFSSPDDALISISDKFIETSTELTDAQAPTDPQVVFNTWSKFSHQGANQPAASTSDLNAWSYNSGTGAVENSLNTGSATGFYSPRKYDSYTHEATLKSGGSDDDILGVIIGYVIEDGKHYTLSAVRQTTGNIIQSGLQWGLVYNINQDHTDNTRDQALLANGTSTAGGATQGWSSFANGTKVRVRKIGSSLSIKTSQWNSTSIDDTTEITFDLNSDSRTQRFAGSVPYGYVAWSQGPASFNGLSFTPDTPESIIHFKDNGATQFYQYNSGTSAWDLDTSSTLGEKKGKFYHNDKTGRTFFNDGDNVVPIGTVRQFNDVIYQVPQSSAPDATTIGALGLKPGMFAVADGTNWDPVNKNSTYPYPVFWDGTQWNALY